MAAFQTFPDERLSPPLIVITAGVCAALQVGKLPPASGTLQRALDMSLVQAGFLLSLVQLAGMAAGIAFGAWADSIGLHRSVVVGLSILALASAAGGLASTSESKAPPSSGSTPRRRARQRIFVSECEGLVSDPKREVGREATLARPQLANP